MTTNALGESFVTVVDWALRWWLDGRGPGLTFVAEQVAAVRPVMRWIAAVVLALAVIWVAAAVMLTRRGHHLAAGVLGFGRFLLVLSGGWLFFAAGWSLSQGVARWILGGRADVGSFMAAVTDALAGAEPALAASLSVLGAATALSFVAVSLARVVLAFLLVVGLPIIAAAGSYRGEFRVRTAFSWLLAVLTFPPLSALVYRAGHGLVTGSADPVVVLISVSMMFVISAAMLPLVVRLTAGERWS